MKFGKVGQVGLVSAIALVVATLFSACSTLTVGFVFVATNKQTPGQIEVYEVNTESGVLRTIPTSPFPSGGRDPVAEAVSPDALNLYVANEDDNNIVQFGIGTDGKLYPQSTVNTPGAFPLAIAINTAGTFLYVVDTLEPTAGCSLANPCPGDIAVFPIDKTTGALGTALINSANGESYWPLTISSSNNTLLTPTALNVLGNNSEVFVSAFNTTTTGTTNTSTGYLFAFTVKSDGTLSELNSGAAIPLGSEPVALASDSGGNYLYVADKLTNLIDTVSVSSLSVASTASTGNQPSALALFNNFIYATNSLDSTVTAYNVNSGSLSKIGTYASDDNPVAITVDPRQVGFLYTVNFLGSSLSGYQIDPTTGTLINTQQSPYVSSVQPTAIAGIPHGGAIKGSN